MNKLIKYTILATIAGVILAFNMYHADYKLLIAQMGIITLLAMYVAAELALQKKRGAKQALQLRIIWLFLAVCVISFITSPHKLASWHELYKIGTWIVFGMIVAAELALQKKQGAKQALQLQIINVWLICAGFVAVYGIVQFFGIDFMKIKLPGGRITSTFGNATLLAGFLAMTMPVAIAKVLEPKKAFSYPRTTRVRGRQLSAFSFFVNPVIMADTSSS